jgi:N-acetylmuramoyl-L-alanine amidase
MSGGAKGQIASFGAIRIIAAVRRIPTANGNLIGLINFFVNYLPFTLKNCFTNKIEWRKKQMNKRLMLDAAHSRNTLNQQSPNGIAAWLANDAICTLIAQNLMDFNIDIRRADDATGEEYFVPQHRVNRTNQFNPDLLISVDHKSFSGKWGNHTGTETWIHRNKKADSREFANLIHPSLVRATSFRNRGIKPGTPQVLAVSGGIPAVQITPGFLDSRIDSTQIMNRDHQERIARSIALSVIKFLDLKRI